MRLDRETALMLAAELASARSTCKRAEVGAVLVKGGRVISTGYNGAASGTPHCLDVGCKIEQGRCVRTVHAELNAIVFAARQGISTEGTSLYCTHAPCLNCAKAIINAGIKFVKYALPYDSEDPKSSGLAYLRESGVDCQQVIPKQGLEIHPGS